MTKAVKIYCRSRAKSEKHDWNILGDLCLRCGLQKKIQKRLGTDVNKVGKPYSEYLVSGKWQRDLPPCK